MKARHFGVGWLSAFALVFEALSLSLAFDIHDVTSQGGWWAPLGHVGRYLPVLLVVGVSAVLPVAPHLLRRVAAVPTRRALRLFGWGFVPYLLTFVMSGVLVHGARNAVVPMCWVLVTLAWLGMRLHGILPWPSWWSLAREEGTRALFGGAVGLLAALLALHDEWLWSRLAPLTLALSASLLALLGQAPWSGADAVLGVGDFAVQVAPVCSGIEGMVLMAGFSLGFIALYRRELYARRALLLTPLFVLGVYLANVVRIAVLILLGAHGHPDIALAGFHSRAGWVFFTFVGVLAVLALRRYALRPERAADEGPAASELGTRALPVRGAFAQRVVAAHLLPLVVLTAVGMVTESLAAARDPFYGARLAFAALALGYFSSTLRAAYGKEAPLDRSGDGAPSLLELATTGAIGGVVGLVTWLALAPGPDPIVSELPPHTGTLFSVEFAVRMLGFVVVIPVVEELAFRGYLLRRVSRLEFETVSFGAASPLGVAVSSLAFGLLHGSFWISGTLCGLVYALTTRVTGSLWPAVIAHALTNLGVVLHALA